jgi:hypothetical protein
MAKQDSGLGSAAANKQEEEEQQQLAEASKGDSDWEVVSERPSMEGTGEHHMRSPDSLPHWLSSTDSHVLAGCSHTYLECSCNLLSPLIMELTAQVMALPCTNTLAFAFKPFLSCIVGNLSTKHASKVQEEEGKEEKAAAAEEKAKEKHAVEGNEGTAGSSLPQPSGLTQSPTRPKSDPSKKSGETSKDTHEVAEGISGSGTAAGEAKASGTGDAKNASTSTTLQQQVQRPQGQGQGQAGKWPLFMVVGAVLGILQLTAVVVGLVVLGRSWWLARSALRRWAGTCGVAVV